MHVCDSDMSVSVFTVNRGVRGCAYRATRNPCVACECTAESESVCGCTGGGEGEGEGEGETEPGVDLSVRLSLNHAERHPAVPPLPTVLRR